MSKKNKIADNPFDFIGKIQEKGIFSNSNSKPKKGSGGIGNILQNLFEQIAEAEKDIEQETKQQHKRAAAPDQNRAASIDRDTEITDADSAAAKLSKDKAAKLHREKILRQKQTQHEASKKKIETERQQRAEDYLQEENLLKKMSIKKKNSYGKNLRSSKTNLRQAFVFTEILSSPIGLR